MAARSRTYSTSELSRRSGDIIAEALRHPVTITQRKKPRLVMMNIEDYERLRALADTRRVGMIDGLSDEMLGEIEAEIERYAEESETHER